MAFNPFYDKAFEFRDMGKFDSAFFYFNKGKDFFLQSKDSLGAGKCLVNMAIISTEKGDYFGGQELSLNAITYLHWERTPEQVYVRSALNNLGISFYNLKNYSRAKEFYEKSLGYSTDSIAALGIKNNIANVYRRLKQFDKSLAIYKEILKKPLSQTEFAKVLSNYNFTSWLKNPVFKAAPGLLASLKIRIKEDDKLGQNSSYAQLAEYYDDKRPDSALAYATQMYRVAKIMQSPDDQLEALQKLIKLSPAGKVKNYFKTYQQLSDSLQTTRASARNQFAVIRYESEKNKADNLKLQRENTEKQYQVTIRELMILAGLIVFASLGITAVLWYRKRREKMESDTRKAITENRLRTSKRVHDVVANGIYRVIAEIENQHNIEKETILDKLDVMYQQSRDISYEGEGKESEDYPAKIAELLNSFQSEHTKIIIRGNSDNLWKSVSTIVQHEIEYVLQEFMVNMNKHSGATRVSLLFTQHNKRIFIHYEDDGIGIEDKINFNNGLKNTGNRINGIGGEITFETKLEKGLGINVSFPVS